MTQIVLFFIYAIALTVVSVLSYMLIISEKPVLIVLGLLLAFAAIVSVIWCYVAKPPFAFIMGKWTMTCTLFDVIIILIVVAKNIS